MKKRNFIISACVAAVIAISCVIYVFVGSEKAENLMWKYLNEQGYTQAEIKSINVRHSFLNLIFSYDEWMIGVVYTNEPLAEYNYSINNGSIKEICNKPVVV